MTAAFSRDPQQATSFDPEHPLESYYNDLRGVALGYGAPYHARTWIDFFTERRENATPVSICQLGIGAWQLAADGGEEAAAWRSVAEAAADWIVADIDDRGGIAYRYDMPHTFGLVAPWYSAMAQAQAIALLLRVGSAERSEWFAAADQLAPSILGDSLGLVAATEHGPVLEEYPTNPPSLVLNGWMFALLGCYDLMHAPAGAISEPNRADAATMFRASAACLAATIDDYTVGNGWSSYDQYPHPIRHVASPFYHALHVALAQSVARCARAADLDPHARMIEQVAGEWEAALGRPATRYVAVARKIAFRMLRPRRAA